MFIFVLILVIVLVTQLAPCTSTAKEEANRLPGDENPKFKRVVIEPRPNYESELESFGLMYHDEPTIEWSICDEDRYWNEEGMMEIHSDKEKQIMEATF